MKVELFPFQKAALLQLRTQSAEALGSFHRTHTPQVVSFTAPTGAGKTIIMASLIESIYYGNETYPDQTNAIFVWLSDSPELNKQSKQKVDLKADKIRLDQCVTIDDSSFDREVLEDGHIYFLNTQKLGKSSNLTKHSDLRQYTIWETISNTAREKSDRLYFIIDEAHRGMQGREAGKATTIMQKFLKGSTEDGISPMPLVIGVTATPERFNNLVSGTLSTTHYVVVTADDVRASGLLKDRIVITYPEENTVNKDMAVLQAAADDWKQKWDHWSQYCFEQHYAYVNPVFVIQVQNNTEDRISDTDLDDCLRKFEERTDVRLQNGEVVHTFGQTASLIRINGIDVRYEEPSRIADDKKVKVVFFKENLSTGWDCPRAETMMSFRHATDATYIAQLLGRMVRTPMQMHIKVDDVLNDVHLYLPYFDANTVKGVVEALQSSEGGSIPTDIYGESIDARTFDILTIRPRNTSFSTALSNGARQTAYNIQGQIPISEPRTDERTDTRSQIIESSYNPHSEVTASPSTYNHQSESATNPEEATAVASDIKEAESHNVETTDFDREEVMKAINDAGLLSYDVRRVRISNYLTSLYSLARLLKDCGVYAEASKNVVNDIVNMIRNHIEKLRSDGKYAELATQVMQFKLNTQIFDVFGETVDNNSVYALFSTTDTDIDRQFRLAETKLGNEGVSYEYGKKYVESDNPNSYKIDVIIFVADSDCIAKLNEFAKDKFHQMNDDYRRYTINLAERFKKRYDSIVSDGDIVSKHNFRLPETIVAEHSTTGQPYTDHLFVDDSGIAVIDMNGWEKGVLNEEEKRDDFVCWLRNPPRKPWSLCIPYEKNGEQKPTYPDFIIIRRDGPSDYVIDILEPHDSTRTDNLGKAKGFAEYARQNPGVGRIQLIRMGKDASGKARFKRLDMSRGAVRDKVSKAMSNDELDHIFETDGFFL